MFGTSLILNRSGKGRWRTSKDKKTRPERSTAGKVQYYITIEEMPLFNWRKCQDRQDFRFCRVNIDHGTEEQDLNAWNTIYDSFLQEFGISADYGLILSLQEEIALTQCDFVIEDRRFLLNKIRRLENEMQELLTRPDEGDMDTCITYLSKWLGYRLNPKKTTVREFYKCLREYEREVKNTPKKAKNG